VRTVAKSRSVLLAGGVGFMPDETSNLIPESPNGEGLPVPPAPPPAAGDRPPDEEPPTPDAVAEAPTPGRKKEWYVVKVQSGREESIKDAIERRVKIERLEDHVGQIIIPKEKVTEMRGGKRVVRERKLYPGYLMVEVDYNDRILYLFRETSGVGDFVGGGVNHPPPPIPPHHA